MEDTLSTSQRAQARHMRAILVTYTQVSIANTTFFSPFLAVKFHYQSPRCCVAAFAILKVEWVMRTMTDAKQQRSTEFGCVWLQKAFVIVRQMGELNQMPFQQ